jgi:hypothetical protein
VRTIFSPVLQRVIKRKETRDESRNGEDELDPVPGQHIPDEYCIEQVVATK